MSTAPSPSSDRPIGPAFARYRALAWATGVFLLLLTLHVVLQVIDGRDQGLPAGQWFELDGLGEWIPGAHTWVPMVHGYLYLAYVIVTVDLWLRTKLPVLRTIAVVLAGTVPFMSFVAEHWVHGRLKQRLLG